jgi:uncharacterized membrane protein
MKDKKNSFSLKEVPANRKLIEELYLHGKINEDTKQYALDFLFPHDQWGLWISRLLLIIGSALILSGVIYFFAYNWNKLTKLVKFASVQSGILICLVAALYRTLDRLSGKVLLLSASVLIGVFFAVFGQIYQTGADAYQLFMMWAILSFGWVIISNFAALWFVWIVITNTFLVLFWLQAALPSKEMGFMIFTYIALFNGFLIAVREHFVHKGFEWLKERWSRIALTIVVLVAMLIPIIVFIVEPEDATTSIFISALVGFIGHAVIYFVYRFKIPDILSFAATVISICIIIETTVLKIINEIIGDLDDEVSLFMMGTATLVVFTSAVFHLRNTAKGLEAQDV